MKRKFSATKIRGSSAFILMMIVMVAVADTDGREMHDAVTTDRIEVTNAAMPTTDVTITEDAGVTVAETGSTIDDDMRLKSSGQEMKENGRSDR